MPERSKRRARGAGDASPKPERITLYEEVTSRIIAELEAGRFPWVQPWGAAASGGVGPGLPRNALTGRNYSGVNVLILWGEVIARAYPSQSWLTFRQALDAGGNVRKGEKGVTVVYADRFTPEAERERAREAGEEARSVILAQHLQPRGQIVGMAHGRFDTERRAQERGPHFGAQFLARIFARAERAGEVAGKPRAVAGPVGLMPNSA